MDALLFVLGLLIVLGTVTSVLFTLVLPRQPAGIQRVTLLVNRSVRLVFVALSRLARTYEAKDAILAPTAPVALLVQLLFWAVALALGFGLMLYAGVHSARRRAAAGPDGALHGGGRPHRRAPGRGDRHRGRAPSGW